MFNKYINKIKLYIYLIFGNKDSKSFINFLHYKWKFNKKNLNNNNGIILVDFFHHYPFIYFWSYLANILSKKNKFQIKYFYFPLYDNLTSKSSLLKSNLKSIYKSFNVDKGLDERDFIIDKNTRLEAEKIFSKIYSKEQLIKFKYKGIHIGDLIYDSYLRSFFKYTVSLTDMKLFELFLRAINNFNKIEDYLNNNKVKLIIPSHIQYFQYAMLVRMACKRKIKVLKLHSSDWGNSKFRLQKINHNSPSEMAKDFTKFRNIFKNLKDKNQKYKLGKKIINKRLSGKFDKSLSYMKQSSYLKKNNFKNKLFSSLKGKKLVVIFCHCFFDAPHKYRSMIFPDFYEQINHLLKLSEKYPKFIWIFKRHPNELPENDVVYENIFKNKNNVYFIKNELNNYDLIKLNIKLAITDHGTVAHELTNYNIPVINTGDNLHIKYKFNFHAKSKKNLDNLIYNILINGKKLKFNKKDLYEFVYMNYCYYENFFKEKKYQLDKCLATNNKKFNENSSILNYYVKNSNFAEKKISSYIENFIKINKI